MTNDEINGIKTEDMTVSQFVEQLRRKTEFEKVAEGFKMNIGKKPEDTPLSNAQEILDTTNTWGGL